LKRKTTIIKINNTKCTQNNSASGATHIEVSRLPDVG